MTRIGDEPTLRARASGPADALVATLLRSGELALPSGGYVGLSGRPLKLLRQLDATFASWGVDRGAVEWEYSSLIPRETLERAEFFDAFPQLATHVEPVSPRPGDQGAHLLSSAVCFHLYPHLSGGILDGLAILGSSGLCFRYEQQDFVPLVRQWAFHMREIVFLGSSNEVGRTREELMAQAVEFARAVGLPARLEAATDPFFAPQSRGKRLLQQLKGLKYELRVQAGPHDLAVASFNLHEQFFGRAFDIRGTDGEPTWSGCVAFGVERWVYALMAIHGLDLVL